jgi:prevent-host-death family protein
MVRRERNQMRVSVTDAKGQLTDLVRRAEAGDEVILTRHGQATDRLY